MKGRQGRLLTVAFQGKQAARSVGGTTVHPVCAAGDVDGGNTSASHDNQQPLPESKAVHWKGVSVLVVEEVSTVG